jgi:AcrR family transcriptional regulator
LANAVSTGPTPRPVGRRPGRPHGHAPADLPARILDAAASEFARAGLDGARVDRIAASAGANVRMLYYYFGNKEGLFAAVLERTYAAIRSAESELGLERLPPVEAMRRLVRFTWEYYFRHPELIALLNSENLHEGRHVARADSIPQLHAPLLATVGAILGRGADDGVFRRGVDPMQLYISIAALGYFYVSNRHTLSTFFQRDLMARANLDARLDHMTEMVLGYLRPVS